MEPQTYAGGSAYISGATDHPLLKAMFAAEETLQQALPVTNISAEQVTGPRNVQNLAEQFIAAGGRQ